MKTWSVVGWEEYSCLFGVLYRCVVLKQLTERLWRLLCQDFIQCSYTFFDYTSYFYTSFHLILCRTGYLQLRLFSLELKPGYWYHICDVTYVSFWLMPWTDTLLLFCAGARVHKQMRCKWVNVSVRAKYSKHSEWKIPCCPELFHTHAHQRAQARQYTIM